MPMTEHYAATEPARDEIDASRGRLLLEFGASWCGICRGAQPALAAAMQQHPDLPHVKVEDGPGRPLGRSFRVKLWPTLVLLQDGAEVGRLVRPESPEAIGALLRSVPPERA